VQKKEKKDEKYKPSIEYDNLSKKKYNKTENDIFPKKRPKMI